MKTVFELRTAMLDYMFDYTPVLTRVLGEWNDKMKHGVPLNRELWYDTFGKMIEKKLEDLPIDHYETEENVLVVLAGVWVDPDNPFDVVFCYKVKEAMKEPAHFKMGDEEELIAYCEERGVTL